MGYLGTKPSNSPLTSELIPDGLINTSDLANGAVTQDKLSTYIAPKGTPAFSAYQSTLQAISINVATKIQFQTERFDTANCFDSTTNYRFTPNVAGYYQINLNITGAATVNNVGIYSFIYKNGSAISVATSTGNTNTYPSASISSLIYFNGTTDYVEGYIYSANQGMNTTPSVLGTGDGCTFSGALVRAA